MQFSPTFCHFISLQSKYFSQHPLLKHPDSYVLPLMSDTKIDTHTEPHKPLSEQGSLSTVENLMLLPSL
jgi:hypothetical protein